ncbi:hypothetical protein AJ85_04065 [Alkalihalobacillus alcalophilus ATCC 27647 = CGMCC 1.3604]|uniref:Uncharacterized protein n=1 Tax=Alkalihalobacillus alcalophilus ATCC 27647 = CGMCC 1.3604 TaxID=1218173 RepID=A0A094YXW9_ALKAL|nr:hypothetical protein [Alkalihalobacillus alcalophilus]KGA98377.1 hypothetical protein BALCAV_0204665 [Alkalihalobacillus alcalophilus ATCC 27647 = CGMCC 1.3604]MED1563676.1 hypothetical protein [Alkalihalobacillus alcalophilus]THG91598.1 hypothetical protein AJ85_04065 [Alkalihalobacillus alcalophilus ATCC 27647 = CGMCC 1.3604]
MYETFGTFDLFRPVYIVISFIVILNFLYLVFGQKKWKGTYVILINSVLTVLIAAILLFQQGIIVDEFNLSGDPITFMITVVLGLIVLVKVFLTFKIEENE